MNKIFLYKVNGIVLEPVNESLKLSKGFNKHEIINEINELLKEHELEVIEDSLEFKAIDHQLYVEGLAMQLQEPMPFIRPRMTYHNLR